MIFVMFLILRKKHAWRMNYKFQVVDFALCIYVKETGNCQVAAWWSQKKLLDSSQGDSTPFR